MLRKINPLFVIAFLLGVGTVAVFETLLSFQASQCSPKEQSQNAKTPDNQKPSSGQQPNHEGGQHSHKAVGEPFVCSMGGLPTAARVFMNQNEGFFIGTFTLLLVIVTAWLVWATIKLFRGAEDTAQRQLRAYLKIDVHRLTIEPPRLDSDVKVTNGGATPVKNMRHEAGIFCEIYPLPDKYCFPEITMARQDRASCQSGETVTFTAGILQDVTFEERQEIEASGWLRYYVFGTLWYDDIFNNPHFSEFCFSIGGRNETPDEKGRRGRAVELTGQHDNWD
jgi:hypothetical protein